MKSKIEFLIKASPLVLFIVTILGYMNLFFYYKFFGIEIKNYLDFSEIPLLFFDNSLFMVFFFIIIILYTLVISFYLKKGLNKKTTEIKKATGEKLKELYEESKIEGQKQKKVSYRIELIFAMFFISLSFVSIVSSILQKEYVKLVYPILILFLITFLVLLRKIIMPKYFSNLSIITTVFIEMSVMVLSSYYIFVFSSSLEQAHRIKYKSLIIKNLSFQIKDKLIVTDSTLVYVGETKNALFLYNSKSRETLVFKNGSIKNLKIKQ